PCPFILLLFFFQAEDGIRDFHVTGVQTCALPICARQFPRTPFSRPVTHPASWGRTRPTRQRPRRNPRVLACRSCPTTFTACSPSPAAARWSPAAAPASATPSPRRSAAPEPRSSSSPAARKLGRASCRENIEGLVNR